MLQDTAKRRNTLQHTATHQSPEAGATHFNTLQHINDPRQAQVLAQDADQLQSYQLKHRNALQHTATSCNRLQHAASRWNTLPLAAT